jgi:hypothetical protein
MHRQLGRKSNGKGCVHAHEVVFRDTAHGFLAWGFATVIGAEFFGCGGQ